MRRLDPKLEAVLREGVADLPAEEQDRLLGEVALVLHELHHLTERRLKTWAAFERGEGWQSTPEAVRKLKDGSWLAFMAYLTLRNGLELLREELEKAAPEVSWQDPSLVVTFDVPEEWVRDFYLADISELTPAKLARALTDSPELLLLHRLTKGAAFRKRGDRYSPFVSAEMEQALEPLYDFPEALEEIVNAAWEPFSIGAVPLQRYYLAGSDVPDEPPLPSEKELERRYFPTVNFEGKDDEGRRFNGTTYATFHPLEVGEDGKARYPVEVGIAFGPYTVGDDAVHDASDELLFPDPATWTAEERETLWRVVLEGLNHAVQEVTGKPLPPETGETGTWGAKETALAVAAQGTFPLAFGRARMDAGARDLLRNAHKIKLPTRKWSTLKPWRELVDAEVHRLLEEEDERAFQDLRVTSGDKAERGPLLIRRFRAGAPVVSLTAEGVRRLKLREGLGRGYRFQDDKAGAEYLTRVFRVGSGLLEVGLSWGGIAAPWVAEWTKRLEEDRQASLFDTVDPQRREVVDRRLRYAASLKDGRRIMEAALGQVSVQGRTPVRIPAVAFRALLGLERDPRWKERVEGGLHALRSISYRVDSFGTGNKSKAYGTFLASWKYIGAGPGDHGEGTYWLTVTPDFLGVLAVFESGKVKLTSGREVFDGTAFDFSKRLPAGQKKDLGWGLERQKDGSFTKREPVASWVGFNAGTVFYNAAEGFSPEQTNLVGFLEHELTTQGDTVSRVLGDYSRRLYLQAKRNAPEATEPRIYTREECPVLPEGKRFHGALGHFTRHPENGRTLTGTPRREGKTGGAHTAGLLSEMGYTLPPGRGAAAAERRKITRRALEDLKAVVEDYAEGVVAVKVKDKGWRTLAEAAQLPERELLERASFYLFVPETWHEDRKRKWKSRTGFDATEDPAEAERAHEALRTGEDPSKPPLREALRARRLALGLLQENVGTLFGVSKMAVSLWERGPDLGGKPIPPELAPFVRRWAEGGDSPTPEELASRTRRRVGVGVQ